MSTREKEIPTQEQEQDSSEDTTQQTNNQQDPPIEEKSDYVKSLEARLAEQQIQYRRLENVISEIKKNKEEAPSAPKPRNLEEERKRFYEDPTGALEERDNKILRAMEKMLEPMRKVASSFEADNEYKQLKFLVRQDPIFARALSDPDIESYVDRLMGQPGISMDENTFKSAISQAVGFKSMGVFGSSAPNNNRETPGARIDPPHVRTNRQRIVKEEPVRKELTEDDRLAMKIAGLKPGNPEHEKEYWNLIKDDTMTLDVHKKKES